MSILLACMAAVFRMMPMQLDGRTNLLELGIKPCMVLVTCRDIFLFTCNC
jgi:hypothetical protein